MATYKVVLEVVSEKGAEELRRELEGVLAAEKLVGRVLALAAVNPSSPRRSRGTRVDDLP